MLVHAGASLTRQMAAIIDQLDRVGAVSLSDSLRMLPNLSAAGDLGRMVPADEIASGETIGRDIYTSEGLLYAAAGEVLTPRMVALLRDLCALNKIPPAIWLAD